MLGIDSWGVLAAYVLCLISAMLCVIYGLWRWNRDDAADDSSDVQWAKTHVKDEDALS